LAMARPWSSTRMQRAGLLSSEIRRGVAAANSRKISLVSIRDSVYPYDRNKDMPVSSLNFCSWLTLTGLLSRLNFN
jgi:hypothetical protein